MIYTDNYHSPLGEILLAANKSGLVGLWMDTQRGQCAKIIGNDFTQADTMILKRAKAWLDRYFAGFAPSPDELPLCLTGSPFAMRVWQLLLKIPYGQTSTYGNIAKQIAKERGITRMSAQAVGNAVGNNPISIIIPCHRVIGANGDLTGYTGGLDKKIFLLRLEGHPY